MTRILYLGRLRDAAGRGEDNAQIPGEVQTAAELIAWIGAREPDLGTALARPDIRIVIDHEIMIGPQARVAGAGEIAFMPPMSGG